MTYSYEEFLKQLGERLRGMRRGRGWSLRDMIVNHGFHIAQLQNFEKGKGISVPSLLRMCEVFELTLEELIADLGRTESGLVVPQSSASAASRKAPAAKRARRVRTGASLKR